LYPNFAPQILERKFTQQQDIGIDKPPINLEEIVVCIIEPFGASDSKGTLAFSIPIRPINYSNQIKS
jgi:hypothetical protein